jgi:hypothetical protein
MKFSAREDIEATMDQVFEAISDFEAHERSALRRGVDVETYNVDVDGASCRGWDIGFRFRGKPREAKAVLQSFEAPSNMNATFKIGGLHGDATVELMALSRTRTRMAVAVEVSPKTLSAKLLVQSMRLAKTGLSQRFKQRVGKIAQEIEDRHSSSLRKV